ncbi:MAG: S41 family peptidase [Sutterella sp.]
MTTFRSIALVGAGLCAGVLSTIGIDAYAEKQSPSLPLMEIRQFTSAFNAIKDYYVDDVSDAKLLQSAVEGMVSGLDPHSSFLDVKGFKDMNESTQGSFGGLGLEVTKDTAGVRVISPIDDTPAARAGMRAGDIITRIDGKSVSDMSLSAAVKLMRGDPDTKIELVVARKGANKPLNFSLIRAIIKTQSVKMKELGEGLGYIRISQFQERTAEDLANYLNKLQKTDHLKGLVLDLRNDPGGLLQAAIGVSAAFLPAGAEVVSTKGRTPQSDYVFKAVETDYRSGNAVKALANLTENAKSVPMVVLINSSSASASEIVAGALQDHKRATIMGDRSFGKGSVQTILPMTFGDKTVGVKLTTARYYTPSSRSIQARGITPDVYIDDTPKGNYPSFQIREADLTHHLQNQEDKGDEEEALKDLPFDGDETETPDYQYMFGDEKDWQLRQAVNYLKGDQVVSSQYRGKPRDVVKKLKAAEAEQKAKAKEIKASKQDSNVQKKNTDE